MTALSPIREGGLRADTGPTFDVLVPSYNYGHFLRDAVYSVLDQDARVRVLVIDDASTDDTPEVGARLAAEDPRVTFVRHGINRGHIATYNEGIDWATGDLFAMMSADDLLMPGALPRVAAALAERPSLQMVYGRMLVFVDGLPHEDVRSGAVLAHREPRLLNDVFADGGPGVPARDFDAPAPLEAMDARAFFRRNTTANYVPASGTFTRVALQKRLGGYRPTLPHSGDYEMWLRFAVHGEVGYLPHFQVAVRRHDANLSSGYDRGRDVLQRVRAIDELVKFCGPQVPEDALDAVRRHLADEALRVTTVALEAGSGADREALVAAARRLDPTVTRRAGWAVYQFKRAIGARAWGALRRLQSRGTSTP